MKICIPVNQRNGLDSEIAANYRAASFLLLIDSVTHEYLEISTSAGACAATPQDIQAIVCAGGIGRGMFNGLRRSGIRVFNSSARSAAEALAELAAGRLEEVLEVACCGGGEGEGERGSAQAEAHHHEHGQECACSGVKETADSGCGCAHH
jgi:predicted Fe-Mo cluster-binding NifX family protein